jgi:hypothetical protein
MDEHPSCRFADDPAGRRAGWRAPGKDAREVIATVRDNHGDVAKREPSTEALVTNNLRDYRPA